MTGIRRALLSVSDKTGVVELARGLVALGVQLVSTGGTARALSAAGLPVTEVSALTGFPELLDGRVKTLHPAIHGGILARRDLSAHLAELAAHEIQPIDLVVVSLYPFERTAARVDVTFEDTVEEIDIGGPAMIRAAAKNHAAVAVVVDPSQYPAVLEEMRRSGGRLSGATRRGLALEAFRRTAGYDMAIATWLGGQEDRQVTTLPSTLELVAAQALQLRYGENPHQAAALYRLPGPRFGVGAARQLHGPELSYNNLLDLAAALGLLVELDQPAAVVIKHTNPCGAATGPTVLAAFERARASDPVSIYGGVVGVNRPVDDALVAALSGLLLEILFAPEYTPSALETLRETKKKLRVLEVACDRDAWPVPLLEVRGVPGGLLVQEADVADLDPATVRVVTRRQPTAEEWQALRFAWRVAKHVKSNAIVIATPDQVLGVGAGQMSRVDAARLAVMRAGEHGHSLTGASVASDAFFPFRDGLDVVAEAGANAVIQPGGSIRDDEVIHAADERRMAMVLTGVRHFKH